MKVEEHITDCRPGKKWAGGIGRKAPCVGVGTCVPVGFPRQVGAEEMAELRGRLSALLDIDDRGAADDKYYKA